MATLSKQALVNGGITEVNTVTAKKTTGFCLSTANQLAARLGGAASLVEAQAKASHGDVLTEAHLGKKLAAVKEAVSNTRTVLGLTNIECNQIQNGNSVVDNDLKAVDPTISNATYRAVSEALREAQAATLGVAQVTDPGSPSPLDAKADMLADIYLTAQKQNLLARMNRPYLLILNKATKQ